MSSDRERQAGQTLIDDGLEKLEYVPSASSGVSWKPWAKDKGVLCYLGGRAVCLKN